MGINKLEVIRGGLCSEKIALRKAIDNAIDARDNSPSAMESHHDTTRNQSEKLVSALEQKLNDLEILINKLPTDISNIPNFVNLWSYAELSYNEAILKLILVPEGYGGREADGIKLVSISTPLGVAVIGKTQGENVTVNSNQMTITFIE
jgi:hypothetical protein